MPAFTIPNQFMASEQVWTEPGDSRHAANIIPEVVAAETLLRLVEVVVDTTARKGATGAATHPCSAPQRFAARLRHFRPSDLRV